MIKCNDIKLVIGVGHRISASTAVNVEFTHSPSEYTPLPGSAEDDGWRHYRAGDLSWSLESDALFTDDPTYLKAPVTKAPEDTPVTITVNDNGTTRRIFGHAFISDVTMQAAVNKLAKFTAKFRTLKFPTLS